MIRFLLDPGVGSTSPVHRLPAGIKVAAALVVVVTVALAPAPAPGWFAIPAALLVATAAASRVPPRALLLRLITLEPFVLGVAGLTLFQPDGLRVFAVVVLRSTLCLATMVLLTATTPFPSILAVFRRARVPELLVTTVDLTVRYLFVLLDEAERMRRARAARAFRGGRVRAWRDLAGLAGQLFVRSTERAERIHAAVTARTLR